MKPYVFLVAIAAGLVPALLLIGVAAAATAPMHTPTTARVTAPH